MSDTTTASSEGAPITVKRQFHQATATTSPTTFDVTFGNPPRSLVVRSLDLGDQFDIAEICGENSANQLFLSLAMASASVIQIDGVPVFTASRTKAQLRQILTKIGEDGLKAVMQALNEGITPVAAAEEHKAATKNS